MVQDKELVLAMVGLGYVGLPLAIEFAKAGVDTIGFDIKEKRIEELRQNMDSSNETSSDELAKAPIKYTTDPSQLKRANFIIVAVPTPVDEFNQPDLAIVEKTSVTVGQNLSKGAIVVYESTVYPGVTEDICIPIIEKESGLQCGEDWFIGYSPERINPGDKEHSVTKVLKIVSGMDEKTLDRIAEVYEIVCQAGVHRAPNIKVAEAAKVFENIQRDVNIALVNELALICNKLNINTQDVLAATKTKWNFLNFRPGLVGGHCIGVDPFYLMAKSEAMGYHPEVITAGRKINDYMPEFVAEEMVKNLVKAGKSIEKAKILVMGLTFKENIRDMRNSKITVTIAKLKDYGAEIDGFDPNLTDEEITEEFAVKPVKKLEKIYDGIIVTVPHSQFTGMADEVLAAIEGKPVIFDISGLYRKEFTGKDIIYQNL